MRSLLWIPLGLLAMSGCYTVLRHPAVREDESDTTSYAYDDLTRVQDCNACHSPWIPPPRPYPPNDYYREPWWHRVAAKDHVASGAMVNDRPRPPVPELLPPASLNPPPPVIGGPPIKVAPVPTPPASPPGRAAQPAPNPRDGKLPPRGSEQSTPHGDDESTPTDSERPSPPTPRTSEPEDTPRPDPPAATPKTPRQGEALPNDRRSPKP